MPLSKVIEMLGVDKLDESKQSEVVSALETIIEAKVVEKSKAIIEKIVAEEKETIIEQYEAKFETYKEDITSKFSGFVDSILEEEVVIPEKIQRYAKVGEMYEGVINQLKVTMAIDEGILDEEVKGLLKEAKDEIVELREAKETLEAERTELLEDAKELSRHLYLSKKCEGLDESKKSVIMTILEGASKEDIDKKFDLIKESLSIKIETPAVVVTESVATEEVVVVDAVVEGKGQVEVTDSTLVEDSSAWAKQKSEWVKMLKESKI